MQSSSKVNCKVHLLNKYVNAKIYHLSAWNSSKKRPLSVTMIVILTIIEGIAFLASRIAVLTIAPFLLDVDINDNNVPPTTGTSTLSSVTIPETLLVGMSVVTGILQSLH
ncbi:MAG TPA: hypothetical protein VFR94_07175 [Nitrososphaeraceae archaeon]|nr:hypothetical protein [Nitrososphaeraceae archaeon]